MASSFEHDWSVTRAKVDEAVRRIVEHANPLQIIAFGSRARGDHREDSDLDLAVILDSLSLDRETILKATPLAHIRMETDLIVVSKDKFNLHRPCVNSVFNYIDREGILLYDREYPESARPESLSVGGGRPGRARLRAA